MKMDGTITAVNGEPVTRPCQVLVDADPVIMGNEHGMMEIIGVRKSWGVEVTYTPEGDVVEDVVGETYSIQVECQGRSLSGDAYLGSLNVAPKRGAVTARYTGTGPLDGL